MVFIYLFTVSSSLFDVEGWTRSRASLTRKPSRNVRVDAYHICSPSLHISPSLAGTHTEQLPWLLRKVSTYYVTPPLAQALYTASSTNRPSLHKPSKRR
ncbi:ATP synthase E chain domain-containing protein [Histoplasma capsulatum G186AR]|uniref:ATP synthase E chain domain-containing protein n=1 Tax=Ajellomyces capsulatus TaxID=5037 RepID=A0A8H7YGU7_AJECA|nr:ATP synthase E chain domain-containing protein [Histoplasma capsulatum]QSS72818.1 ATP synthase E chain domain-containing protein [Histoplasma capsulatum G186AR]